MPSLVFYDTTASVIEVLWDIVLAYFVLRISAIYSLLATSASAALYYGAWSAHIQDVLNSDHGGGTGTGTGTSTCTSNSAFYFFYLVMVPLQIALTIGCGRLLVAVYEMPRHGGFPCAVGSVSAVMTAGAGLLLGAATRAGFVGETGWVVASGFAGKGLMMLAASMPLGVIAFPREVQQAAGEEPANENEKTGSS